MTWGAPASGVLLDGVLRQPLAPWWKRLVAILIDGVIIGFSCFVITLLITAAVANHQTSLVISPSPNPPPSASVIVGFIVLWIFLSIPAAIYYGAMNGSRRGQTVGKRALGICVRDARSGGPIGFWRGMGRYLITIVFTVALYIPYIIDCLAPLWDVRRQAWHDKVAHTVVVDLKP